jgi:MFS superfamily sulfate permease-like transporter
MFSECVALTGWICPLSLALLFTDSAGALFQLFPVAVLGVDLFLTGVQLAVGSSVLPTARGDRIVVLVLVCAALCMWNIAAGSLAGVALHHLNARGLLRL